MMYKIIKHNHQFKHNDIIASPSSDSKTYDPCAKKTCNTELQSENNFRSRNHKCFAARKPVDIDCKVLSSRTSKQRPEFRFGSCKTVGTL